MMLCSSEAPEVPVASKKSGNVYERRLIEAYIRENGTEPTTGESLTSDDLITLQTSRVVRPRPATLTSIPSLLGVFQDEWDALALETYKLKESLVQTRQELSTALYQHDAARRVIARLSKERDEAREALGKVSVGGSVRANGNGDAMQVDSMGSTLPEALVQRVDETHARLQKTRRKRPVPAGWVTDKEIKDFMPGNPSDPVFTGGRLLAINAKGDQTLLGASDGRVGIFSASEGKVVTPLNVGRGDITDGLWVDGSGKFIVSTSTGQVKMFDGGNEFISFSTHAGAATAVALHPCGSILASVGDDKSYAIYDLDGLNVVAQVYSDAALTSVKFHPDGHLLAAGSVDGKIKLFDVKTGAAMAEFEESGPIKALDFSENGIWLATAVEGLSTMSIWDLRKTSIIHNIDIGRGPIESIQWDYTGQFLLTTGGSKGVTVHQYSKPSKSWSETKWIGAPTVAAAWGKEGHQIQSLDPEGRIFIIEKQ